MVLLVLAALVAQVAQLVPAVPVAQAVQAVPVVRRAQGSLDHAQVLAAEQQQVEPQVSAVVLAHHVRVEVQARAVAAVSVVEPPVPSVKVALAVHPRLASRSARNAKSTNREQHRASVEQLFHAATAPRLFVCVVALASKTLPTRLMPMQVS